MRKITTIGALLATALMFWASAVSAQNSEAEGIWKTQPGDTGGYLNVEIKPCENAEHLCGFIVAAYSKDDVERADYEHLGKQMIWRMINKGTKQWKSGKIWAPDVDKKYRSKMKLDGDTLVVSGCVAGGLICRAQKWSRL